MCYATAGCCCWNSLAGHYSQSWSSTVGSFFYDSPMISTKCNSPYYVCVCVCSTESVVCIVLVYCTQHHKRKKMIETNQFWHLTKQDLTVSNRLCLLLYEIEKCIAAIFRQKTGLWSANSEGQTINWRPGFWQEMAGIYFSISDKRWLQLY